MEKLTDMGVIKRGSHSAIVLSICIILCCYQATGQESFSRDYRKFEISLAFGVSYPVEYIRICKPIICLIRIDTDTSMHVSAVTISDSADSLYRKLFDSKRDKIDVASLEKYLKMEFPKMGAATFVIPFMYEFSDVDIPCTDKALYAEQLKKYNKFRGEWIKGSAIFLQPIYLRSKVRG